MNEADLLVLAETIAREAGELVLAGRRAGLVDVGTKSTGTDVVTEFDRASETLIARRLHEARPDDALLGEEGTSRTGTSGVQWIVDPIDGTTNFLYDLPLYSVSIGAADAAGTIVGAVYVPAWDVMFSARRGNGATRDGRPIGCSTQSELATTLVATGFGYLPERRASQGTRLAALLPAVRDVRRLGSAALDLCLVAAGMVDAYYEQWLNPWDVAAGELIAAEGGARLGTFPGRDGEPDGIVASSPGVFDSLIEALGATNRIR
jgi:myo-inositol-1(or 4)-monophosphatase